MWMMGYNDGGELNFPDSSFNGRKLRPLMPRPLSSVSSTSTTVAPLNRIHANANDIFALHHMATMGDQSKREFNSTPPVVVSSRWNPTPEQLRVLEELYRRGTRTPSADQIQHITGQLRRYGKIEGKNVFYWFQNHKARERQKRRRQMESAIADVEILERKDSGSSRTAYEVEQTKNWAPSINCSTLAEESVPIQRAAKAAQMAESRTDGWIEFDEVGELHQRRNMFGEKNLASLQMMQFPNCTSALTNAQLMMNTSSTTITATVTTIINPKSHNFSAFTGSYGQTDSQQESSGESETLQLFPLCSDIRNDDVGGKEQSEMMQISSMNNNLTPLQFYEFLPLKN